MIDMMQAKFELSHGNDKLTLQLRLEKLNEEADEAEKVHDEDYYSQHTTTHNIQHNTTTHN
jgi:hypothetical protein